MLRRCVNTIIFLLLLATLTVKTEGFPKKTKTDNDNEENIEGNELSQSEEGKDLSKDEDASGNTGRGRSGRRVNIAVNNKLGDWIFNFLPHSSFKFSFKCFYSQFTHPLNDVL